MPQEVIVGRFFKVYPLGATAVVPGETWGSTRPIRRQYETGGWIEPWKEWEYRLEGGAFADYQNDNIAFRLCSERLKNALEEEKSPDDVLQWLPVSMTDGAGERRRYWILHFPNPPDVLDRARSEILGLTIGRMVLDSAKIGDHRVLPSPDGSSYCFVVPAAVRDKLHKAGLTGMEFRPVASS